MSNIFPDDQIVADILGSRLGHALHKINFRQMLALESIARDLTEMMHPKQLIPPRRLDDDWRQTVDPLKWQADPPENPPGLAQPEIGPALQHSRKRRQSGVPE